MFLLMHQSVSWPQVLLHISFSYLKPCYKLTSQNVCYYRAAVIRNSLCVVLDVIVSSGYVSMGWHVFPAVENANTAVMVALARPLSISYTFLSPCMLRLFQYLEKESESWFITVENSCRFLKNCQRFRFLVWQLQPAEACNWKGKLF